MSQPQPTCKLPGCNRTCYVESYGRVYDFCGRTHAQEYSKLYGYGIGTHGSVCVTLRHCVCAGSATSATTAAQRRKTTPRYSSGQPLKAVHYATGHSSSGDKIKFYNRYEPYYEFTNFYQCNVFLDDKLWPTTEHYFQAQKFVGTPYFDKIRRLPTPRDAFQLSRDPVVARWRRGDWESVKDDIMLRALRAKFSASCSVQLRDKLRGTGDKELVEHTSNDSYWGDGGDGTGKNKLGKLLMRVRSELYQTHGPYIAPLPQYLNTRDDSSILSSHRSSSARTTTPRLRRSNSLSSIASHDPPGSHTSCNKTATGSHAQRHKVQQGHQKVHAGSSCSSPSFSSVVKKNAETVIKKAKDGASKMAATASQVFSPSTRPITRGNMPSVNYNIITHEKISLV